IDARGPLPARDKPRRAAAAVERGPWPDEPRGPTAAAPARGRGLQPVAPPAPVDEARDHRAVAGPGAAGAGLRSVGGARPRLHRSVVDLARPQDHGPHDSGNADGPLTAALVVPWRDLQHVTMWDRFPSVSAHRVYEMHLRDR